MERKITQSVKQSIVTQTVKQTHTKVESHRVESHHSSHAVGFQEIKSGVQTIEHHAHHAHHGHGALQAHHAHEAHHAQHGHSAHHAIQTHHGHHVHEVHHAQHGHGAHHVHEAHHAQQAHQGHHHSHHAHHTHTHEAHHAHQAHGTHHAEQSQEALVAVQAQEVHHAEQAQEVIQAQETQQVSEPISQPEAVKPTEPIKVSPSIGGFIVSHTKEKVSIYQAMVTKLVSEEAAVSLLEAQAATGGIIQLSDNQKLSIEAAVQQGVVGPEYQQKLIIASSAALGYKDKEETLSLFQAFKKGLIGRNDTVRFLEAQVATGGIIDYVNGNRISVPEALTLNYIDEQLLKALTENSLLSKCYFNPNSQEYSTYQELVSRSVADADTGLLLFPLYETLQGLRKPVTYEQLFRANIINQVQYDDISQGKLTIQSLGGLQEVRQYLQGQASIGAVYIESIKEKLSVYQALKKNFLSLDTAVALLEAQAASGFLIDPVKNTKYTVTEAVQDGLIGLELKEKLLTAERAVTGFSDPYTGNKISLFQAIKKELIDKKLGANFLQVQVATGGIIDPVHSFHVPIDVAYQRGLLDKEIEKIISTPANATSGFLDPNTGDLVTYQELQKRSTLDPESNTYVFPVKITFNGLRGKVSSDELLESLIIDKTTYDQLQQGTISVQDVSIQENVRRYLRGTGSIAGVAVVSTNERKNIYQAMKDHLLMPGTAIALLEAQAATGYLLDPVKNLKFSVEDAVKNGLIGAEIYEKLLSAEKAAVGYKDPSSGQNLSLFQAIKRGFVLQNHGIHLLEAQLATGGIIDPSKKHRVPEEVAYTRGVFDKETNRSLLEPTDDIKGFFDPSAKQNVTYGQLLERCLVDSHTGLYLIPVFDNTHDALKTPHSFIDYQVKKTLNQIKLTGTYGKFKGQVVTLWQLLFSEYFTIEFRESLFRQYKSGSLSIEELSSKVQAAIQDLASSTKVTFEGLRVSVTPGQLLESEIIDKDLFEKLQQGKASTKDVVNIDTVKKYLQGTGCIGGLVLTDTQEKISIYSAKRKGLLRPGTSLILLEAQAATGFIIDPVKNKKYSVDEALKANIIGPEVYEKLLSAEKSVTGYRDPYTGEVISLFQAMSKDLIVKDHGIRLLEAQIATGGIIDPINSHRIPVEVAYKRGYFDKKMNVILSDPSDDTKGFFDPNTNENLTYLQLKERCITDPSTSLCLLPLHSRKRQLHINDYIKDSFRNLQIYVRYGRFKGQTVSAWVLINSEYFSEWRRREILEQFRLRKVTIEQVIILIEEEIKKWTEISVPALRGQVNIHDLLDFEIIDKDLFEQVLEGKLSADDVFKSESVQRYVRGSGVLGGIVIQPSNQKISFYEATKKNILQPSTVLTLLEAQAATGNIIDPVSNQRLSVSEALKAEVIDPQVYTRLVSAEKAVTGYKDPFSGKKISLFQAMKKGLVEEKHAKQFLEAQIATGGVIDPIHNFHIPSNVAKKLGYINEEVYESLSHPTDDSKSFYDPKTKENVTYSDLLSRSQKDESTGIYLLPLPQDFAEIPVQNIYTDEEVQQAFRSTRIEERNITIWELIHSGYFTEEQRFEILEKYKSKKVSIEILIIEILQIVKNHELKRTTDLSFQGLRGKVPVVWLLDLGIITQKTFDELVQGIKSIEEISQLDDVKRSLQGTGGITGVFIPSTKEKISIYQAIKKNLIMPAYGVRLLEAQAATGFLIDPITNEKHTVDSAVRSGLVGPELHEKLLHAESAVTGYLDPYTGNKISLGEAIHKKLITKKEGLPLLQAQLASGGIVDPLHYHYVPLQVSYKLGLLDEELSKQTDALKIYFDPNTKEKLSYQQLKERSYTDPETGSLLLSLSESAAFYADGHLIDTLKSVTVSVNAGRFKGQTVSVWELLNSEYVSIEILKELILLYKKSSSEGLQEIIKTVTTTIEQTDASSSQIKFKGLRKQVSASDLFQSNVIDRRTLDELNLGKKTIGEVTEMDNVKRYLQGTNCIAGILIQSTNTKMSIYEAMLKRILRPGTALVLLEAQAATGFIADPVKNRKLSVDEALAEGLIGIDVHAKLLSAEQAVTGYTDPYTGDKISLFQAMQKNLIVECHGIRLLEAQIATGGIIDPVHSHRVPVEVAYKRGYFNEEMNKILSDPSDDTKGFFDPNTHENLTYLQLVERCIQDPETGFYLLQVVNKRENYFYITDQMKSDLKSRHIRLQVGHFAHQTLTVWEILSSHYFTELKRRELIKLYTEGVLNIDLLISSLTTIIEEYDAKSSTLKFQGIRGEVSATELYNADIIDEKTIDDLRRGKQTIESISQQENVKRYLRGKGSISGVLTIPNNETISIFEAIKRGILSKEIGLALLEAQISTGFLVDPAQNQPLSISEALSAGLINEEDQKQLDIAEKAFSGFTDPESGKKLSLFEAIKKEIIPKDQGIRLLEYQLATGGIVDPIYSFRLPLHVAYRKGYLDEDLYIWISNSVNGRKRYVDPNTHERIGYKDLLERCVKDPKTGLFLIQVAEKRDDYFYIDDPTKNILISTAVKLNTGKFKGQDVSLWDLLNSTYISESHRNDLIKQYKLKTSTTIKDVTSRITSIIEEKERGQNDIWFQGLRKQVTAAELYDAGILSKEVFDGLQQEPKTVVDVAKTDSVKRYLEGTSCIAGVLIPSKHDPSKLDKLNIYDAMLRRLLRPGTALVLLEAQAATGFVIDSVNNRKLSVEEALPAGVIGHEIYEKLLTAEKAVTGYTDPYTGDKISLFQALQKDLIVKEHGIRFLEAQIATGGIIDPVHSHRVPVEIAYKRGYFNEEMNQILSDPTDDTKGFFDPNTHENLTYLQLLQRCVTDPDTGLYMLELKPRSFSLSQIQTTLKTKLIQVPTGEFQGKSVSIWEFLNSQHISKEKREELLKQYESGILTVEEIITVVIKTITEEEVNVSQFDERDSTTQDAQYQGQLQAEVVDVYVGDFKGQSISLWELLHSRYFSEDKRREILGRLKYGTLTIKETITYVIKIITEAESFQQNPAVTIEEPVEAESSVPNDEIQRALQSISMHIEKGQYAGQDVSVWELLHSVYISDETQQELLDDYKLTVQGIMDMVIQSVQEADQALRLQYNLKEDVYHTLQNFKIDVTEGKFKGQTHTLWDLLQSSYFSEEKKRELLDQFNSGVITVDKLIKIIITVISETEERSKKLKFKGLRRQITATELLSSEIIDQNVLTELAQGRKTVEEVTQMDSVKRYLEGTSCIAGVLVPSLKDPSKKDTITIYNANLKNIITPGTALVLLEAQAATGFIIDPVNNKKLSVDEAVAAGIIGSELHKKLLSAERAVTGYKDPYTGDKISLFQAMQKELIVREHGIRLLEAQIATGGIIDPVHSHRVPVEVAYKRGYFDEDMNTILSDPTDDTKGFFDPNTRENLTYLQLLQRCIQDPETGLYMLDMKAKTALPTGVSLEASLTSHTVQVKTGRFKDQKVSISDFLQSEYFTEETRQQLLKQYNSRAITKETLITTIEKTIEEWEQKAGSQVVDGSVTTQVEHKEKREDHLKSELVKVTETTVQEQKAEEKIALVKAEEKIALVKAEEIAPAKTEDVLSLPDKTLKTAVDEDLHKTLNIFTVRMKKEEFQSKRVSLWDILHSKYISEEQRNTQLTKYQISLQKVKQTIIKLIEGSETKSIKNIQQELEGKLTVVTAGEFKEQNLSIWFLLHSKYFTEEQRKELLEKYRSGAITIEELLKIIITIIEETEKSRNLKFKGFRRQVTATELLQSEIIDQNTLTELTQGSKTVEEVTQMDNVKRYLEGTSSIAGVFVISKKDPSHREKKTIYDAMLTHILRPGTALILLEAQAATGFVVDPIKNQKLSVDEALSAGLIGYEIYEKLLSAERGVTGYKDPYTGEKISLFQAMKKDLIVKDHGIRLLEAQIATGGIIDPIHSHRVPVEVAYKRGYFDEEMNQILSDPSDDTKGFFDPNTHENLTYLQLLQRCVTDPDTGLSMLEVTGTKIPSTQIGIETILKSKTITVTQGRWKGKGVAIWEILNSEEISAEQREELIKKYKSGTLSVDELTGLLIKVIHEKDETLSTDIQTLLEAQTTNVSVGDFKGRNVSVWELLNSRYILEDKRKEIIEKLQSGAVSVQEAITILITIINTTENAASIHLPIPAEQPHDVSIQEDGIQRALQSIHIDVQKGEHAGKQISVWDLIHSRYIAEPKRRELLGNYTLTVEDIVKIVAQSIEEAEHKISKSTLIGEYNPKAETYKALQTVQSEVNVGDFKGQKLSVWDLLNTKYFSEEKKRELLKKVDSGEMNVAELIKILITFIEETEESSKNFIFKGLRRQVGATELLTSEIIDYNTLTELTQGRKTVEEVTQLDRVKRYLEGTSCIAGVLAPSLKDPSIKNKISIYNAMIKNIITPGTALVLLEAQAATGFIIDPVNNKKLSVDEAVAAGIIGPELRKKLLSAERAVTGYTNPYTGDKISLFQAMQKELIVREHGIRLLEAQIATGGIIDPVHSHRVPVEVAYKRGYFDEEMNTILSDPTDDTKGFFDPNTRENLTYLQLLQRCIQDPETGLYMLDMKAKKVLPTGASLEASLTSYTVQVKTGRFKDQKVSISELLQSEYFTEETRQQLLKQYNSGVLTIETLITTIVKIIEEWEQKAGSHVVDGSKKLEEIQEGRLRSELVEVTQGKFQGQKVSVWELLYSDYITESKKKEIIQNYYSGVWNLEEIIRIIKVIIRETEENAVTTEKIETGGVFSLGAQLQENIPSADGELNKALTAIAVNIKTSEFQEQKPSLWEVIHSKYLSEDKRKAQLDKHQLTVEKVKKTILQLVEESEPKSDQEIQNELELKLTEVSVGEFKGQNVSVWFLLHSKYISEEKRQELLGQYRSGAITIEELLKIIITIIEETEKSRNLKFKGFRRQVTATELLQSEIIDQNTLTELTQGSKTVEEVTQMDNVKRYLEGTSSIAGVFVTSWKDPSHREKKTIYDAMLTQILRPGTALILLEAQAATGFVVDPIKNQKLSVDEALSAGLIGYEIYEKLLSAERGVTGYKDPYTGEKISLFQAMKKDLIVKDHGIRLLEAQIATGGIIDPIHSHRVPVEVAYKRGYFDEEMNQILSDPSDDTKGFFDPNTHENLTYLQLLQRCVTDPDTGLYMLDVKDSNLAIQVEENIKSGLQSRTIQVDVGAFKGKQASVWDLLYSQDISIEKREELLKKYRAGTLTIEELITILITIITETVKTSVSSHEESTVKQSFQSVTVTIFKGSPQEESLSLWDLLHSKYIPEDKKEELLEKFKSGTLKIEEIINIVLSTIHKTENVSTRTKVIVQEEVKVITAPIEVDHWPSEEQLQNALRVIPSDLLEKQSQQQNVSAWDLLNNESVPKEKKSELLQTYKLSVREVVNTCSRILKESSSLASEVITLNEEQQKTLQSTTIQVSVGHFAGQTVSVWDLLQSSYFTPEKRRDVLLSYSAGTLTTEDIIKTILSVIIETKEQSSQSLELSSTANGHAGEFSATSGHAVQFSSTTSGQAVQSFSTTSGQAVQSFSTTSGQAVQSFSTTSGQAVQSFSTTSGQAVQSFSTTGGQAVQSFSTTGGHAVQFSSTSTGGHAVEFSTPSLSIHASEAEQTKRAQTQTFLQSVDLTVTAGQLKGHKSSLWELLNSSYISSEKKNEFIEGYESGRLSLQDLMKSIMEILIQSENVSSHHIVTVSSEKTDTEYPQAIQNSLQTFSLDNYSDAYTGQKISLWDLLHYKAISQGLRLELLSKYYNTVKTIVTILTSLVHKKVSADKPDTTSFLKSVKVQVSIGEFKLEGKTHSLWDLLHSKYVTEGKRRELLEKYESKSISWEEMFKTITTLIKETEEKSRNIKFHGLRKQVSASELLKSEIIDQDTILELAHGTKSLQEVTQMKNVKRYLEGTNSIAGVLVPSKADPTKKEKMSIYDAMLKRILRQGTALVLLEAQAATGFIIDPIKNAKLTVDEAVAARVFGQELQSKLLSAERAVTGYIDPTTNQKISLFQAMQKDLIVKDHGIRLLEAQIATGGIIDPVYSHRVPVEVAYKRGYFDEEMNKILSDPSDDTKGFFDPNTHENLTYLQLLQRAVPDPDTGLLMLEVANK